MFNRSLEGNSDCFKPAVGMLTNAELGGSGWEFFRGGIIKHEPGGKFGSEGGGSEDGMNIEAVSDPVWALFGDYSLYCAVGHCWGDMQLVLLCIIF